MRKLVLAVAAAVAMAMPAATKPLSSTPDDLSIQAVHNFATCIANTTPEGAVRLLALDYRTKDYQKSLSRLAHGHEDGRCMSASILRANQLLLAGGMAERLLVEKVKAERFPALMVYDANKAPIAVRSDAELTSICVIRAEPVKAFAIFQTDPTSADETRAMQAIGPALLNCVKSGQKMAFNKPGLRAMLALASYRLTQPGQ
jgi:hypothetical protein